MSICLINRPNSGPKSGANYVVVILLGFNLFLTGKDYKRTKSLI